MNRELFNTLVAQYKKKTMTDTNQIIQWDGGVHCNLPSLKFYGVSMQNGTPTPENPIPIVPYAGMCTVQGRNGYLLTPSLHGIGDYKDEWDYVTGKGIRRVDTLILDGVTSGKKLIAVYNNKATGLYFGLMYTEYKGVYGSVQQALSTHFKYKVGIEPGNVYIAGSGETELKMLYLVHTDQTLDTVEKYNAWLKAQYDAGTPVTVCYALAEPQSFEERPEPYTPIPNESGSIDITESGTNTSFELSYITHS